MLRWFFLFGIFVVIFGAAIFIWWQLENEKRRQRVLKNLASKVNSDTPAVSTTVLIEKPKAQSAWRTLFTGLTSTSPAGNKAAIDLKFLLLTVGFGCAGFVLGKRLEDIIGPLAPWMATVALGAAPKMYRSRQRAKRLAATEEQFPEALDFLARSVRAGNAFSIALELYAAEAKEPLKSAFLKVTREMALGAGLEDALRGLIDRVPLFEVRFFVSAVLLQRETGGNLSEVLGKLAGAVRERARLQGQVKAASGQGRLTAKVLTVLPIAVVVLLKLISPSYLENLTNDPVGRNLLAAAVVSQTLGYLCMQKIARVEV
jgi:tight adherence protein B